MTRLWPVVLVVGLVVLTTMRAADAAGRTWIEAKSPHFAVISDTGERTTRSIAWQFEQVRTAIAAFWSWANVELDRPLVVIAVGDEAGMKALAPQFWEQRGDLRPASVFVTGPDRHYIALRTDVKAADHVGINPYVVAYWSYVDLIINAAIKRELPLWFSRGLASVMSNTIVRESRLDVGQPIPWHLRRLQSGGRLKLADLVKVDRTSPWYTDATRLDTFDAECWAFVHYLMFGDEGAHRQQFDRFLALIVAGNPPASALEGAFGNVDSMEGAFFTYIGRQIFQFLRVNLDTSLKPDSFVTRTLSNTDALVTRAAFHTAMRRPAEARAAIEDVRKLDANSPASYDVEGMLLDIDGKQEDARAAYGKAVQLGSTQFYTHYRLAQLLWAGSQREDAQRQAGRALAFATTGDERRKAQEFIDFAKSHTALTVSSAP